MKKLTSFLLTVILLFSITAMSANAAIVLDDPAKKLDHIQVLVDKPAPGGVPATVASTSEPANVSVKSVTWSGNFDENGCFVEGETYTATFNVAINDGADLKITDWYSYKFTVNGKEAKFAYSDDSLKNAVITYTFANLGAPHQNHCFCGGELTLGEHTEHEKHTYKPWKASGKIEYKDDVAYIYLTSDTTISETFRVPGGKIINLCLNGYTLKKSGGDRVINISSGGKLRLCDCSYMKTGKVLGGSHQMGGGIHNGGTFIMYGGKVMNNRASYGGGLWNNYNFVMYGGEICYNKAGYGGGVWNANSGDASFIIYGGKIYKNDANYGAGLWNNDNGNITMSGGEISENIADECGGGVWNQGKNFNMTDGWIRGNFAQKGAGVWTQSLFTMSGGFISLNHAIDQKTLRTEEADAYGGGVWVNDKSLFYMKGGQISLNKADMAGGGVWVNNGAEFVMQNGSIAANKAQVGGGVYIQRYNGEEGVFRLSGESEIVQNTGTVSTGGIYVKGYLEVNGGLVESNFSDSEFKDITVNPEGKARYGTELPTEFVDVKSDSYYYKPVLWALEKGITNGTSDITFSPDEKCNLAQVITFLHRAAGSPEVKTSPLIADVYKSDYYYMAAYWGQSKGMFSRALYGNFSSNRVSSIYFMWCAAGKPASNTKLKFTDLNNTSDDYRKAVAWAVEQGITNGTSATTFSPSKTCTRAEIITFLYRYYGK